MDVTTGPASPGAPNVAGGLPASLDELPLASDWIVIARCALRRTEEELGSLMHDPVYRVDGAPDTLLVIAEEMLDRLRGKTRLESSEAAWGLAKVQAALMGAQALVDDKGGCFFREVDTMITEINVYTQMIDLVDHLCREQRR